jgi:hypothetical protein
MPETKYKMGDIIRWKTYPVEAVIVNIRDSRYVYRFTEHFNKTEIGQHGEYGYSGLENDTYRPVSPSEIWKNLNEI